LKRRCTPPGADDVTDGGGIQEVALEKPAQGVPRDSCVDWPCHSSLGDHVVRGRVGDSVHADVVGDADDVGAQDGGRERDDAGDSNHSHQIDEEEVESGKSDAWN